MSIIQAWSWANFEGLNKVHETLVEFFFNYNKQGSVAKDLPLSFSCLHRFCIIKSK